MDIKYSELPITYHKNKVGISYFSVLYKGSCYACLTPKEIRNTFGPARNCQSVKDACAWAQEQLDKHHSTVDVAEGHKDTSFASVLEPEDPNYQTRTVI